MSDKIRERGKHCALCGAEVGADAPVLAISSFGSARLLCNDCAAIADRATLGRDYEDIVSAIGELSLLTGRVRMGDITTIDAMAQMLDEASKRAEAIKEGSYDFSEDECETIIEEIPEELRETEEDRLLDEREAEVNRKFDRVMSWVALGIFAAVGILALYWFGFRNWF